MTDFIQCRTKKYKFRSWAALIPFGAALPILDTDDPGLRFPGQWAEGETGLLQNWHRDYDPSLGRYIEADPLGLDAGQSLYGYVGQDPLGAIDPEGLFYTDIVIQYLKLKRAKKNCGRRNKKRDRI